MKERVFNTIIFIGFVVLLLIFSLKCFLISFGIIKEEVLLRLINKNINLLYSNFINQTILVLIGSFILLVALYLIWLKQKMAQQLPYIKVSTDSGEIKISTYSLEQIILTILNDVKGIRRIKPEILVQKTGNIKTILQLVIDKDSNIPNIASLIQQKLKEELPKVSGVEVEEIKINIDKIEYE